MPPTPSVLIGFAKNIMIGIFEIFPLQVQMLTPIVCGLQLYDGTALRETGLAIGNAL
jgi:hypothetical protein